MNVALTNLVLTFTYYSDAAVPLQHCCYLGTSVTQLDLDLDLVNNRQTSRVEYHADGGSAARYGESFASRCLKLLTASAVRRLERVGRLGGRNWVGGTAICW